MAGYYTRTDKTNKQGVSVMIQSYDHSVDSRKQVRDDIASQVNEFLKGGGKIEVLNSPLDNNAHDPKCRFGEEMGLFL